MALFGKIREWIQEKRLKSQQSKEQKQELADLHFEEEALKRIKRIGELRAEVDKLILRRAKKGFPISEEADEAEDLKVGMPLSRINGLSSRRSSIKE